MPEGSPTTGKSARVWSTPTSMGGGGTGLGLAQSPPALLGRDLDGAQLLAYIVRELSSCIAAD